MNITPDFVKTLSATAKAYDAETDMDKRRVLGARLDELSAALSDGQIKQVVKMMYRN